MRHGFASSLAGPGAAMELTKYVDSSLAAFSDRGSTPLASTNYYLVFFSHLPHSSRIRVPNTYQMPRSRSLWRRWLALVAADRRKCREFFTKPS